MSRLSRAEWPAAFVLPLMALPALAQSPDPAVTLPELSVVGAAPAPAGSVTVLQGAFADHANTLRAPGYVLLGLQTGIDFADGVSLFVEARNLTNARYISDIAVVNNARTVAGGPAALAAFYPGNGRSVFGGVRASF